MPPARTFSDKKKIRAYLYTARRVNTMQVRAILTAFSDSSLKDKGTGT